ncbi:MAG: hypothetical protein CTY24_09315 [Methylobacter sp.]|nr:MAG: hypothetical protein CTY24_09315 [Methylobacter sp.]
MIKYKDIIGIGFGPANISLAITIEEKAPEMDVLFLESNQDIVWHPDAQFAGTDIQNHPLRDLVTPRNPKSHYSFTNFLKETGRLFKHLNLPLTYPLRKEYAQYIKWVGGHFYNKVQYNKRVINIDIVCENNIHKGYKVTTDDGRNYFSKAIVIAPGRTPYIPSVLEKASSKRIIHFNKLISTLSSLENEGNTPKNIAVIGGSQSAVEIILDLRNRYKNCTLHGITRSFGYRQKDASPFMGEVYFPEHCNFYFDANKKGKEELDRDLLFTNYSAADKDVVDSLYVQIYEESITENQRVFVVTNREIMQAEEINNRLKLTLINRYSNQIEELDFDLVIAATGFRNIGIDENQERVPPILDRISEHLDLDELGCIVIHRDYNLRTLSTIAENRPIMLNGLCEKSHGMGDAGSLSLVSLRSEIILNHVISKLQQGDPVSLPNRIELYS